MMGSLLLACSGASGPAGRDPSGAVPVGEAGATAGERIPEPTGCTAQALEPCTPTSDEGLALGIDVFDGQGTIDWAAVAGSGVTFAWIKATQGTYDTQATFAANWPSARRAGVVRGAYHFFDPTDDGAAQAQRFLAAVGPLAPGDLPPMLDLECPDGDADCLGTGASGSAPAADIGARMWDWIHAVEAATGTRPVLYTFGSYFTSGGVDPAGLDAYPLFLAQPLAPPARTLAGDACLTVPAPWSKATMWQYSWTGTVPGIEGPVDRDAYLGPLTGLQGLTVAADGGPERPDAATASAQGGEAGVWQGSPGCL
jgi:lysozyme